jgi:large subunit ribosomal protein L7/L12
MEQKGYGNQQLFQNCRRQTMNKESRSWKILEFLNDLSKDEAIDSILCLVEKHDLTKEDIGMDGMGYVVTAYGGPGMMYDDFHVPYWERDYDVVLASAGDNRLQIMKQLRKELNLGLREIKHIVDSVPSVLKECVKHSEAKELKETLENLGATVEVWEVE